MTTTREKSTIGHCISAVLPCPVGANFSFQIKSTAPDHSRRAPTSSATEDGDHDRFERPVGREIVRHLAFASPPRGAPSPVPLAPPPIASLSLNPARDPDLRPTDRPFPPPPRVYPPT